MKEIKVTIPEYLSIGQYQEIIKFDHLDPLDKMLKSITLLSDFTEQEVREWPLKTISEVAGVLMSINTEQNEFHAIVEYKDEVLGFANLARNKFGEFIDLQTLLKDPNTNLHHIAALLFRPITKHRFGTWSFIKKYGLNTANNKIDNPFDWYTIGSYDSEVREERSEMMKDFPVQLILGGLGFIAATGTLSLNDTLCSMNKMTIVEKNFMEKEILQALGQSTTGGGGLFTALLKLTSSKSQEIQPSQILTS
jgi:hypothetical protein